MVEEEVIANQLETLLTPAITNQENYYRQFDRISLEMIYRGLYHFSVARQKGLTNNPIKYFAAPENQDLGIVKSIRKLSTRLIIAPFPERQKNSPDFFFSSSSQTHLTTALQA